MYRHSVGYVYDLVLMEWREQPANERKRRPSYWRGAFDYSGWTFV